MDPVIWNERTGHIVGGHQRLEVMKEMGTTEVEVSVVDLPEDKEKALNVALNKISGEWDQDKLVELLHELGDMVELTGFDAEELDKLFKDNAEVQEDNFDADAEVAAIDEPITKRGDIYQLGRHRLMCGDSTMIDDVDRLMDGKKADMVFTDPPYSLETEGGCKGEIGKSLRKQAKAIEFISEFNPLLFLNLLPTIFEKNKINAYVFCNKELLPDYLIWARDNKYSFNVLVWKKPNAIPIGDSHRPDIEYLLLFRKSAIWNNGLKDVNYSRLIEASRETGLHPTMKPVGIIANEMMISSNKGSVIVDLFGGSGSTLIACEQLNRICYMMELDEKYCDVIIKRWEELTGQKAELISG